MADCYQIPENNLQGLYESWYDNFNKIDLAALESTEYIQIDFYMYSYDNNDHSVNNNTRTTIIN